MSHRIAIVTDSLSDPPRNGRELPLHRLAGALAREHRVDLVLVGHAPDHPVPPFFTSVRHIPFRRAAPVRAAFGEIVRGRATFMLARPAHPARTERLSDQPYDFAWCSPVGVLGALDWLRTRGRPLARTVGLGLNDVKTAMHADAAVELLSGRYGLDPFRIRRALRWPLVRRAERRYLAKVELVHVQTEREHAKLDRITEGMRRTPRVVVAPNGVNEDLLALPAARSRARSILYMTHLAAGRARESGWFLERVWPQVVARAPEAELLLVGTPPDRHSAFWRHPPERAKVLGFVDDLAGLFSSVRLAVVPTLHSTGVVNRILDAMAAGVPVVTTPEALSTLSGAEEGAHALCADNAEDFARDVLRVLDDDDTYEAVRAKGRAFARAWTSWEETTTKLVRSIEDTIAQHIAAHD